jgi:hypothetical protein
MDGTVLKGQHHDALGAFAPLAKVSHAVANERWGRPVTTTGRSR